MSAIRDEIIRKLEKLDETQQAKVLQFMQEIEEQPAFDLETWMSQIEDFQAELRSRYGDFIVPSVQDLLDEVREGN